MGTSVVNVSRWSCVAQDQLAHVRAPVLGAVEQPREVVGAQVRHAVDARDGRRGPRRRDGRGRRAGVRRQRGERGERGRQRERAWRAPHRSRSVPRRARSISRRESRSAMAARLSYDFLPFAIPSSSFAWPFEK